ncbi:mechanosensitive ion channel family protein [Scopulibacillus cellulosilyticus]|uniref:Mechanosensitive ion channel family protein n=1 Tax=Scopulibacillus cellulosilyticus TaxID=2665665 RepID=A0ABW2PYS4_9BACL
MQHLIQKIHWENILETAGIIALKLIIVIIAFFILKAVGKRFITHTFEKIRMKKTESIGRIYTLERLILSIFSYCLSFILIVVIFNIFNLDVSALIAGAGVVGLAVGFGAQGLVSDVVTGFFLLLEKQMDVGDYITVSSFEGIVEEIGLRTTQIRGFDGTLHYIPNRNISNLSNHSRGNMRALVDIAISYKEDVDRAIDIMQEVCEKVAKENRYVVEGPNVLGVQTIGSNDIVIRIVGKTVNGEQWGVESDIKKGIKKAFEEHGIELPQPQFISPSNQMQQ